MSAIGKLFNERNRLWSIPLIAAGAGLIAFYLRNPEGVALRALMETLVSSGIAFVLTATWSLIQDIRSGLPKIPSRIQQYAELKTQRTLINTVHQELRSLESGLQDYLAAKKVEGAKFRETILDIENDIAILKKSNTVNELKEQLSLIAGKFGELAGVRSMVGKLSDRLAKVEDLAKQVDDANASVQENEAINWFKAVEERLERIRHELSDEVINKMRNSKLEQAMDDLKVAFESELKTGVQDMLSTMDEDQVVDLLSGGNEDRFKAMDRRLSKLSKAFDAMQKKIEQLRWVGTDESGIPSIYRSVQGLDMGDPDHKLKSGCLAKLFNANKDLRKAAA